MEIINILLSSNKQSNTLSHNHTHPFSNLQQNNHTLTTPLPHDNTKSLVIIQNIIFLKTKKYSFLKTRKKGVVKRKVLRKVIKNNFILD
jgi:hypothetical protein